MNGASGTRTVATVPVGALRTAVIAGIALGLAFSLSPLSVVALAGIGVLLATAGRGLPAWERRWLLTILGVALLARVAAIVVMLLATGADSQSAGILFGDEGYLLRRSWRLRNLWMGQRSLAYDYINAFEEYGRTGYLFLIGYLQVLIGPTPYALRLVNAGLFVGAGCVLYRLARNAYGEVPALVGLTVLLFLPTQFAWSISMLKEAPYVFVTSATLAAAVATARASTWGPRATWAGATLLGFVLIWPFRAQGVVIMVAALGLALGLWWASQRARRAWAVALATPLVLWLVWQEPRVQAQVLRGAEIAARGHIGHAFTVGHAYKTLDAKFYQRPTLVRVVLTPAEAGRFAARSLATFVVVPMPWDMESRSEWLYLPEHVIWFGLLALAAVGLGPAFQRDKLVTSILLSYTFVTSAAVAVTSGNVGTLIRHRSLSIPFLVWFSAVGLVWMLERRRTAAPRSATT